VSTTHYPFLLAYQQGLATMLLFRSETDSEIAFAFFSNGINLVDVTTQIEHLLNKLNFIPMQ